MKRFLFILLLLILIALSGYFILNIMSSSSLIEKAENNRQSIDWFEKYIITHNLTFNKGKPVCLIFFNPQCDYCRHEAEALYESRQKLDDIQWFWISEADINDIEEFKSNFLLFEIPKLQMIHDSSGVLTKTAGISTIPQILLYDHSGKLAIEFKGETKIEAILRVKM